MSNLEVEVYDSISEIKKNPWNNVVESSKLGSFFHRYEWLKAVEEGIGLQAKHIQVLKNANPVAIFPNFITSIETTPLKRLSSGDPGFGGPIVVSEEKHVLNLLVKQVSKICTGKIISHYISALSGDYLRYGKFFEKRGYRAYLGDCRFIIDLDKPLETIKSQMNSSKRRILNKISPDEYIVTDETISDDTLKVFYENYTKVLERVSGVTYPFEFFIHLNKNVKDRIKIFDLKIKGEHAGKLLFFLDTEQASLHSFFSAVEPSTFRFHAPEVLNEYAIKWGIEHNFETYDFGGTSADFAHGLFKFKKQFGGRVVPTLSWEKGYSLVGWNLFKLSRYLYHKIR